MKRNTCWKSRADFYVGDVEIIGIDSGSGSRSFATVTMSPMSKTCDIHGNLFLEPPKMPPPPKNRALTRPNEGTMTMLVNSPLIRPYFFDRVASP